MIDHSKLILELARGIVRANQSDYPDKMAEDWTEQELFVSGFYMDAESFLTTLKSMDLYVAERKQPKLDEIEAVALAVKKSFPKYERLTATEAAKRLIAHLHETTHIVRRVIKVPAFGGEKENSKKQLT